MELTINIVIFVLERNKEETPVTFLLAPASHRRQRAAGGGVAV